MSTIFLHPGDLSGSDWLLIIFVWLVLPVGVLVFLGLWVRGFLRSRAKKNQAKTQDEV